MCYCCIVIFVCVGGGGFVILDSCQSEKFVVLRSMCGPKYEKVYVKGVSATMALQMESSCG
jgi:hypothetical protein